MVLTFKWLKTFIDFNTLQHSLAKGLNEQQHIWEDAREFEEIMYVSSRLQMLLFYANGLPTECLHIQPHH